MGLTEAARLAVGLLNHHGLRNIEFRFNGRRRHVGLCFFMDKIPFRIELSRSHVLLNSRDVVLDSILHEIAHVLTGRKHDLKWKAKCRELGCRPEPRVVARTLWRRWIARCPNCSQVHARGREPVTQGWYCKSCGPQLGPLMWRDIDAMGHCSRSEHQE